jgi:hypothetical protein
VPGPNISMSQDLRPFREPEREGRTPCSGRSALLVRSDG